MWLNKEYKDRVSVSITLMPDVISHQPWYYIPTVVGTHTLGHPFDPSIRWNIVVSRFHLIDGF